MILTKIEKDVQKSQVQGEEGEEAFYVNKYEDYLLTLGELAALKPGVERASLMAARLDTFAVVGVVEDWSGSLYVIGRCHRRRPREPAEGESHRGGLQNHHP